MQGRHDKSAHKEFLSHTLKNKVKILIFLYYMKIIYIEEDKDKKNR